LRALLETIKNTDIARNESSKLKQAPLRESWLVSAKNRLLGFDDIKEFSKIHASKLTPPVVLFIVFAIFQTLNLFDVLADVSPFDYLCENISIALFWPLAIKVLFVRLSE
jgi:hypothetical protein